MAGGYGSIASSGQQRPAMRRTLTLIGAASALAIIALAGVVLVASSQAASSSVSADRSRPQDITRAESKAG